MPRFDEARVAQLVHAMHTDTEIHRTAYDLIFLLSGVLSLIGGGIVNVNIQLASLKERVREVGVKMAIGAPGREIFKGFLTEAMLLTGFGAGLGFRF
mgnify:CR=1 FL=1